MRYDFRVERLTLNPSARSAGVGDHEVRLAEELLDRAGHPFDAHALFAAPLGARRVAIVRATPGRATDIQLWHAATYARLGDPFRLADLFPPESASRGELPTRECEPVPLPRPQVADLIARLGAADMPLVLGATQALVDGVRVRLGPGDATESTLRLVWDFLPDSTRGGLWPHTGVNARTSRRFDAEICAVAPQPEPGVLTADQCRDYPEGRYEFALQSALERGDQEAVDALFARRSSAEALQYAAALLALTLGGAAVARLVV